MTDTIEQLQARIAELKTACSKQDDEVCQTLGRVLGYPWFKDDQKNFPGSSEAHGVCVGEHVASSIAAEAATKITAQAQRIADLEAELLSVAAVLHAAARWRYTSTGANAVRATREALLCKAVDEYARKHGLDGVSK